MDVPRPATWWGYSRQLSQKRPSDRGLSQCPFLHLDATSFVLVRLPSTAEADPLAEIPIKHNPEMGDTNHQAGREAGGVSSYNPLALVPLFPEEGDVEAHAVSRILFFSS